MLLHITHVWRLLLNLSGSTFPAFQATSPMRRGKVCDVATNH